MARQVLNGAAITGATTATGTVAGSAVLTIKGAASQTADLTQWQNSGGTTLAAFTNLGTLLFAGDTNLYRTSANTLKTDGALVLLGSRYGASSSALLSINTGSVSNEGIIVRGVASQTADLQQWQDSSANLLIRITKDGSLQSSDAIAHGLGSSITSGVILTVGSGGNTGVIPLVVRGAASQVANLTEWRNSAGTALTRIDWNGTIWAGAVVVDSADTATRIFFGSALDVSAFRSGVNTLRLDGTLEVNKSLNVGGDDLGKLYFGSVYDTNLYRSAADKLKTDDEFIVAGNRMYILGNGWPGVIFRNASNAERASIVVGHADGELYLDYGVGGGTNAEVYFRSGSSYTTRLVIGNDGKLYPGPSPGDTNLYRGAANTLRTDDQFIANSRVSATDGTNAIDLATAGGVNYIQSGPFGSGGATDLWIGGMYGVGGEFMAMNASKVRIGSGTITFGGAEDTNLYRSTANTLRTDDSLVVSGNLFSVNAIVAGSTGGLGGVLNALSPNAGQLVVAVRGAASQTADLTQWQNSAGNPLLAVNASGTLLFGTAQDTNLYRGAANILQTDDDFYAQQLRVTTNAVIAGDDTFTSKLYIGATPATRVTLYRSSDGVLATDNLFNASAAGIRTKHEGNSTVPSVVSSSGQLRASTGRLWMNDAGTWRQLPGPFRFARRIAGNITVNSTSWVDIGDTSLDIVLDAAVGDVLEASINALWGNEALNGYLDVVTVINGGPLGFFSSDATTQASDGIVGWGANSGQWDKVGSPIMYTVQSGDLVGGKVRLRLRTRTSSASNKTLYATGTDRLFWSVKNLGSVSFQPTDLSGLQMWLAADWLFGLSDGNEVATWADMSGNGRDLTQATSSKRPTYKTNILSGLPVVRFDGADDNLARASVTSSSLFGANTATIFVVQKQVGTEASNVTFVWESTANTNRVLAHLSLSDTLYFDYGNLSGGGRISGAQPAGWDDAWKVIGLHRNGTAGKVTVNGVDAFTGTYSDDLDSATATFYLGADSVDTLNGDIAEFIIYNRALSAAEYLQVQRYLGAKYAIAVA